MSRSPATTIEPVRSEVSGGGSGPFRIGWLAVAGLILLTYNSWIWWQPLGADPAILHGYLSELAATDQPHHTFYRVGDLITSGLLAVTAVVGLVRSREAAARRWWTAAYAALILLAAAIGCGAVFAMDCSPTLEQACAAAERAGQVSVSHQVHTVAGVAVEIGLLSALVCAGFALRAVGRRRTGWLLFAMAVIEVLGLLVIGGFVLARIRELSYPQIVTVLNASIAGALAAVGNAFPRLRHRRGDR